LYGTCEDKKAGGDAEAAAREGGDETAKAQTGAEVRALPQQPSKPPHTKSLPPNL